MDKRRKVWVYVAASLAMILFFLATFFLPQEGGLDMASASPLPVQSVFTPLGYVSAFFIGGMAITLLSEDMAGI